MRNLPALVLALVIAPVALRAQSEDPFFRFSLSEVAAPGSVADWSWMNEPRAGAAGPVRVQNGRFVSGGRVLRWVGVNTDSPPPPERMEAVATHLARFGVNIVRFHHIDAPWHPNVFGSESGYERRQVELDPNYLTRLHRFVRVLENRGIYVNLNLLTGRWFSAYDGLPEAIDRIEDFKVRHLLGFWYRPILDLQKRYARDLLLSRGDGQGPPLKDAPNLALVEINNEAGLIHSWRDGLLEGLPEVFAAELRRLWNRWLVRQVGDTGWEAARRGTAAPDPGFRRARWSFEQHEGARARFNEGQTLRVQVERPGSEDWHVQLVRAPLDVVAEGEYEFQAQVRADRPAKVWIGLCYARPPWTDLGWSFTAEAGTEWREVRFRGRVQVTEAGARLVIGGLGLRSGWIELRAPSLVAVTPPAERGRRPSAGEVELISVERYDQELRQVRDLWSRFLRTVEEGYWTEMVRYLREELKVSRSIVGTVVGTVSPHLARLWDATDTHAYWQHPEFPGRPWDLGNYFVRNLPMVRDTRLGTLVPLSVTRAFGRPFTVSEYHHSAPNLFSAEAFPLLAVTATLQDWDGYYGFFYMPPDPGKGLRDFFELTNHPTVWASFGPSAQLYRQGLLPAARGVRAFGFPRSREDDLAEWFPWEGPRLRPLVVAVGPNELWTHRVGLDLDAEGERQEEGVASPVRWEASAGMLTVAVSDYALVSGFLAGREGEAGPLRWSAGTNQSGWGQIQFVQVRPGRWLLVVHGVTRPAGRYGKLPREGERLGDAFWEGTAVEVEPLPLELWARLPAGFRVWALDGSGSRQQELPTRREGEGLRFRVGRESTLWYEIAR